MSHVSELSNPTLHTLHTLSVTQQESFHHNVADSCTGNVLQPLLFCSRCTFSCPLCFYPPLPDDPPTAVPVVSLQAWTLVALAATSMRRNPVQWPSLEPLCSSASSLFSTQHWPSTTVLFVGPLFFPSQIPFFPLYSDPLPADFLFFLHHEEWFQKLLRHVCFSAPGESPHRAFPTWLLYVITHHPKHIWTH